MQTTTTNIQTSRESAQTESFLVTTYQKVEINASKESAYESYKAIALRIAKLCGCEKQAIAYLSKNRTYDEILAFTDGMVAMSDSLQTIPFEQLIDSYSPISNAA